MPKLYLVATPIGNLEDLTFRAAQVLRQATAVAAEDKRVTQRLLDRYSIETPLLTYHQHSVSDKVIGLLASGQDVALVSDAGTPGLADPGGKLVAEALTQVKNLQVIPIPGPSALTALISIVGLPAEEFTFLGFLPHKKGKQTLLKEMVTSYRPTVFYESVHRIIKTLTELTDLLGAEAAKRPAVVGRELTKMFETVYRGSLRSVLDQVKKDKVKGEYVIFMAGKK